MPNDERKKLNPDELDALFPHDGSLRFDDAGQLTDGARYYGTAEGRKLTLPGAPGNHIVVRSEELTLLCKPEGSESITVMLDNGEIFEAGADDGFRIDLPPPLPIFSGQLNEYMRLTDYYARDFMKSLRMDILNGWIMADASTWGGTGGLVPLVKANEIDAYAMTLDRLPKGVFESSGRVRVMRHPIEQFRMYTISRGSKNPYNPFVEEWREPPNQGAGMLDKYNPAKFLERCGATCPDPDMDPEDCKALVDGASLTEFLTVVGRNIEIEGAPGEIGLLLYGANGSGKSSIAKALALGKGDLDSPYFKVMSEYPAKEMELYYSTVGTVIVELSEGAGLDSQTIFNRLKSDITRQRFRFAGKWEVFGDTHPKRYTEIGTTNSYWGVPEDNRRVCPLEVIAPERPEDHAYVFPTEDMRGMYWNARRMYEKDGIRASDIYRDIQGLVARARRFVIRVPDAWGNVQDFAEDYMRNPGDRTANAEIRDYLINLRHNTQREADAAISWLKDHGFKDLGWERIQPKGPSDTKRGSYAREVMGRDRQRMDYQLPSEN